MGGDAWLVLTTRPRRFASFLPEAIIAFFTSLVGEFLLPLALLYVFFFLCPVHSNSYIIIYSTVGGKTGNSPACHELERRWLMAVPFGYVNIAVLVMAAFSDYDIVWSGGGQR